MAKIKSEMEIEVEVKTDWSHDSVDYLEDSKVTFKDSSRSELIDIEIDKFEIGTKSFGIKLEDLERAVNSFKAKRAIL